MSNASPPPDPIVGFDGQGQPVTAPTAPALGGQHSDARRPGAIRETWIVRNRASTFSQGSQHTEEKPRPHLDSLCWDSFQEQSLHDCSDSSKSTFFDVSVLPIHDNIEPRDTPDENAGSDSVPHPNSYSQELDSQISIESVPGDLTSNSSNNTVRMSLSNTVLEIKKNIMYYEDDFKDLDPNSLPVSILQQFLSDAQDKKSKLQVAMFEAEGQDLADYDGNLRTRAENTKVAFIKFIRESSTVLAQKTDQSRIQSSRVDISKKIKSDRVGLYKDLHRNNIENLATELALLRLSTPESETEFRKIEDRYKNINKRCEDQVKDTRRLLNDAVESGLENESCLLQEKLCLLQTEMVATDQHILDLKHDSGFSAIGHGYGGVKASEIPPPTFSGDPADKTDFFTFQSDFQEYVDSRFLGTRNQLKVLQKTCLKGSAKQACEAMTDVDEVWKFLKTNYGNPKIVFNNKIADIRKLGSCTGSSEKKRDWALKLKAKLRHVQELAKKHNILQDLYFSSIVVEMQNGLPNKIKEDFHDILRELEDGSDRKVVFDEFMDFLDKVIKDFTFDVNYEMSIAGVQNLKHDKTSNDKNNSNKVAKKTFFVQEDDSEDEEDDPPRPTPTTKSSRQHSQQSHQAPHRAQPQAQQQAQPQAQQQAQHQAQQQAQHQAQQQAQQQVKFKNNKSKPKPKTGTYANDRIRDCVLCNKKHVYVYFCEKFIAAPIENRMKAIAKSKCCFRCLKMSGDVDITDKEGSWTKHKKDCSDRWVCKVDGCGQRTDRYQVHQLVCGWHADENKSNEADFLKTIDASKIPPGGSFFFNLPLVYNNLKQNVENVSKVSHSINTKVLPDVDGNAIFMLQKITVDKDKNLLVFFDSGCESAAISDRACSLLETETLRSGTTRLLVSGGEVVNVPGGDERFFLELEGETDTVATFTGIRMPKVTHHFPTWNLQEAWKELNEKYTSMSKGKNKSLPSVPKVIGGVEVDIIIGIKYKMHYPKLIFSLPSGLAIYKAPFKCADGHLGILGGPHRSWKRAEDMSNHIGASLYLVNELKAYFVQERILFRSSKLLEHHAGDDEAVAAVVDTVIDEDYSDNCPQNHCAKHSSEQSWIILSAWDASNTKYGVKVIENKVEAMDNIGTEANYRCIRCRNCDQCRKGDILEKTSFNEEREQLAIEDAVQLNIAANKLESKLPFIADPEKNLFDNFQIAKKVLESQIRKAAKNPELVQDIVKSHDKLRDKGHVVEYSKLPDNVKTIMKNTSAGYYIPWNIVYKTGSLSTPVRMVFDASSRTPGGESLNNITAKGMNKLANILGILIKFRSKQYALSADISMAYNQIKLLPEFYNYQKYLWKENLDPAAPLIIMVVITLIYGVRPSGNLTIEGIRKVAEHVLKNHPDQGDGARVLLRDTYMDDILTAQHTEEDCRRVAQSIEFSLGLVGMGVKEFTFSGSSPSENVSGDGRFVGAVGYNWDSKHDIIFLNIKDLYLGKPKRGKLPPSVDGDVSEALRGSFTKRTLLGKVAGVYDPLGVAAPVTSKYKLDLHAVHELGVGWDDEIPESFLATWVKNLDEIQQLKFVGFRRTVIPVDAIDAKVSLIVSVDASKDVAAAVVHGRVKRTNGKYSTTLIAAKTKLVTNLTVPRAELKAAVMGSILAHTVKFNLADQYTGSIFVSDSSISLFWINQDQRPLQTGVRNCVIEVRRLTQLDQWFHVSSDDNLADLGTRGASIVQISPGTEWQDGKPWMHLERDDMPLRTVQELILTGEEKKQAAKEMKAADVQGIVLLSIIDKVAERYSYSNYLYDPCARAWPKAVRVVCVVLRFIKVLKLSVSNNKSKVQEVTAKSKRRGGFNPLVFTPEEIRSAEDYFFKIATKEVTHFSAAKYWKDRTFLKNDILYYNSRYLGDEHPESMERHFFDVKADTFVVPVVDRFSPVAYSVMSYVHQRLVHHRNSVSTLRETSTIVHVIQGRDLSIEIYENCVYCKRFKPKLLKAKMGPIHASRLTVAPAFFNVQVDLFGPYKAICEHQHRSTVKVWGVVFKCPTTHAISVHAMQTYDNEAFIQSYIRFSSRYGHPAKMFIDEGGQLLKACNEIQFSWVKIAETLNAQHQVGIDYQTCPVGGHNANGVVERSIREVKKVFNAVFSGLRLDLLSYETCFSWISCQLNNLPFCLGSKYKDLEHLDLVTPSRLLMGRNNSRAPAGPVTVDKPSRLLKQMEEMEKAWWRTWRDEKLVDYIPAPAKWNKETAEPKPGDIVLFMRDEKEFIGGSILWRVGRVVSVETSSDGKARVVRIEYKNSQESVFRSTRRPIRKVAVLHCEGDLELSEQLNEAARQANIAFILKHSAL